MRRRQIRLRRSSVRDLTEREEAVSRKTRDSVFICGLETRLVRDTTSDCPERSRHTPAPEGYTEWFEWAEKKARTYDQVQCPGCGLFKIWRRRAA